MSEQRVPILDRRGAVLASLVAREELDGAMNMRRSAPLAAPPKDTLAAEPEP
jgi:hypothetical protein